MYNKYINNLIMKKITLLFFLLTLTTTISAQENDYNEGDNYNHWSLELGGGFSEPGRRLTTGFNSDLFSSWAADLGLRYMINDKFGFKLNLLYTSVNADDKSPADFQTNFYSGTLEGVVNVGSVLNFRDWTKTFNILGHAGAGYTNMTLGDDVLFDGESNSSATLIVGITPQVRLSDKISLYADMSFQGLMSQKYAWDGYSENDVVNDIDGNIATFTAGIQIYLGNKQKHADWVDVTEKTELRKKIDSVQDRMAKLENDLQDEDQDGVPNYLDREPNTMNGVAVDSKGVAVDKNNNGIPDEIESSLDERYTSKTEFERGNASAAGVKKLLNDGYVNVYFQFNSDKPEIYSYEAINYLVKYMTENPNANAELIGYADEIGNASYNQTLSEKRAKRVYDILVASGVEESRLEYRGAGADDTVDKSSSEPRQLVRRVTFKVQ